MREKLDHIFRDKNIDDCEEEEEVLEINNFELIDLDEIEEIQGVPFKSEPLKTTIFRYHTTCAKSNFKLPMHTVFP